MTVDQKIIKNKMGLLNLAEELGNVSRACRVMGFSDSAGIRFTDIVSSLRMAALRACLKRAEEKAIQKIA